MNPFPFSYVPKNLQQNRDRSAFVLICTTTGAQTLTFGGLTIATGKTLAVDWGDGSSNIYAGSGARTHNYTKAGVWTVSMSSRDDITLLNIIDAKVSGAINSDNPMPPNLTSLTFVGLTGLTWTVNMFSPMPTRLETLMFIGLPNLSWTINADAPMPANLTTLFLQSLVNLRWTVNASAPMPTGMQILTLLSLANLSPIESSQWAINSYQIIRYENNLTQAQVDGILQGIWTNKANYTYANPSLDLSGIGNAAPSGVYASVCPPTTGNEYKYDLVNGICTSDGPEWTVVSA